MSVCNCVFQEDSLFCKTIVSETKAIDFFMILDSFMIEKQHYLGFRCLLWQLTNYDKLKYWFTDTH